MIHTAVNDARSDQRPERSPGKTKPRPHTAPGLRSDERERKRGATKNACCKSFQMKLGPVAENGMRLQEGLAWQNGNES